jgi:methylisocitrate lyase
VRNKRGTSLLRQLLGRSGILVAPGAYNALVAKIIEEAGFDLVYVSGSATASALLGVPDVGLLTMQEMAANAKCIANAVGIPVISDADTGYGNAINMMRTVKEFEKAGVAGIQIEDQTFPKRCGHMEGKGVISSDEMVGKIKAAIEARDDPDFVLIARTDARAVHGLEEAVRRSNAYKMAGADVIFPEALQSVEELKLVARSVRAPLLANMTEWGKTPLLTAGELEEMGYKIVIFPVTALRVAQRATKALMAKLRQTGTQRHLLGEMETREELDRLVGLPEIRELEKKYGSGS